MPFVEHHRPNTGHHLVRWAWIAMAMIPVGLVLATALSFVGAEHGGNANVVAGTGLTLIALAPSAASIVFVLMAKGAGERSSRPVLTVSIVLSAVTIALLGLPLFAVSRAALPIAVAVYACGIVVGFARMGNTPQG